MRMLERLNEDACSLLGLPLHEKYATTVERVLNVTRVYMPAAVMRAQWSSLAGIC